MQHCCFMGDPQCVIRFYLFIKPAAWFDGYAAGLRYLDLAFTGSKGQRLNQFTMKMTLVSAVISLPVATTVKS